jgi:sigma-B regulation protein RsbU (phosphoserine phosphatase)
MSNLRSELQHLEATNDALAVQFRHLSSQGHLTPQLAAEIAGASEITFLERTVSVWDGDKGFVIPPENKGLKREPFRAEKVKADFAGIVVDRDHLDLRAIKHLQVGERRLTVISNVPLTSELLQRTATQLGSITLLPPEPPNAADQPPASTTQTSKTTSSPPREIRRTGQIRLTGEKASDVRQKVSAGAIPPAASFFDTELVFGTLFPVMDWDSGIQQTAGIGVRTRPSVLYSALFDTMGDRAGIYVDVLKGIAVIFAIIELIALYIGVRLTRTMTKSVAELYSATQHVNRGELGHRISIRTHDQMATLEKSFNSMTESLSKLIAEQKEKQRLESELAIAHEVQALLFPLELSDLSTLEVHGVCRPARTVSGDYYDFIPLRGDKLVLALGDISGKGISAALLMATVHAFVRAYSLEPELALAGVALEAASGHPAPHMYYRDQGRDAVLAPGMLMATLNYQLFRSTPPEKYATMFLGCYDAPSRSLIYSNAGHLPPMLLSSDGGIARLDPSGTVVGLFDGMTYDEGTVRMDPGDVFVAFSDGITEPENEFGEFGEDRLVALIRQNREQPLSRISDIITNAVCEWIGSEEQPDDMTIVLARSR